MISKPEYKQQKEYWDFQRVIEYNKEKLLQGLRNVAKKPFAPKDVDPETMFDIIWNQMREDDYETPTKSWIHKNENYIFEWEPDHNIENKKFIKGIQGQLWSETITNKLFFDRMINPRLATLSEIAWKGKISRSWIHFRSTLLNTVKLLEELGWGYHEF